MLWMNTSPLFHLFVVFFAEWYIDPMSVSTGHVLINTKNMNFIKIWGGFVCGCFILFVGRSTKN